MEIRRTQASVKNISYNFIYQLIATLMGLILRTCYIKCLGGIYLGIDALFADILGIFSLADIGIATTMTYNLYKPLAENDYQMLSKLMTFYRRVYNGIALVFFSLGMLFLPFVRSVVSEEARIPYLEVYYILLVLGVVCSYLFIYNSLLITADQKGYINSRLAIVGKLVFGFLNVVGLVLFKSYLIYIIVNLSATLISNLIINQKAKKLYPFLRVSTSMSKEEISEIFGGIRDGIVYKVCGVLLNSTDNILISILISTMAVGLYANYNFLANKFLLAVTVVFSALGASIGNLIVEESVGKRYEIFDKLQSICFSASVVLIGVYVIVIDDFIVLWIGKNFCLDILSIVAISIHLYMSIIMQPLWAFRDATGLYKKTKWIMVLCAVANLVISIVLGKVIGLAGIVLGTIISKSCTYFMVEPRLLFHLYFDRGVRSYYLKIIANLFITVVAVLISLYVTRNMVADSWFDLGVKLIVVTGICLVISALTYSKQIISCWFIINKKQS